MTTAPPAVRTERVAACPLCGSPRGRFLCAARDRQHGRSRQEFRYRRCVACGVVYQALRPVEADIATFYPTDYPPYQAAPAVRRDGPSVPQGPHLTPDSGLRARLRGVVLRGVGRLNAALGRRYPDPLPGVLQGLYTPARPGMALCDFGCGSAAFLDHARARGWDTLGVDFLPAVVDAVRRAGHRAVMATPDFWDAIPDGSLDLIRLNHVVEHLYDPRAVLGRLRRKLRPGGRLHLATPNAASLTFRLFRWHWYPLECPRHVLIFGPRAAGRLIAGAGFSRHRCYHEVLTKDTARSLGYLMEHYGWLDTAGALGLMNHGPLAAVLFAPARLAALAGVADRLHVVAEA